MTRNRKPSRTIDVIYRFDPDRRTRPRAPRTPAEAQAKLVKGNRTFVDSTLVAVRSARLALESVHGGGVTLRPEGALS